MRLVPTRAAVQIALAPLPAFFLRLNCQMSAPVLRLSAYSILVLAVDVDDAVREPVVAGWADGRARADVRVAVGGGGVMPNLRSSRGVERVDGVVWIRGAEDYEPTTICVLSKRRRRPAAGSCPTRGDRECVERPLECALTVAVADAVDCPEVTRVYLFTLANVTEEHHVTRAVDITGNWRCLDHSCGRVRANGRSRGGVEGVETLVMAGDIHGIPRYSRGVPDRSVDLRSPDGHAGRGVYGHESAVGPLASLVDQSLVEARVVDDRRRPQQTVRVSRNGRLPLEGEGTGCRGTRKRVRRNALMQLISMEHCPIARGVTR